MPADGAGAHVGFLGAGQMGRPMVDRLVAAGVPTEVYARRAEARAALIAAGIPVADSAADLASRADVLIVCFFSDAQVREVLLGDGVDGGVDGGVIGHLRPGAVLVSHVTGSPALPVELQQAAPDGVAVLDAPISGTDDHIRAGQLTLMVGGDPDALERARPALATYGNPILTVGGLGDGQRIKLVNNLLFTAHLHTALAAAELGRSLGIEPGELARVVSECSGDSFVVRLLRQVQPAAMVAGAWPYLAKDVAVIREVAAADGIDLGTLGEIARWIDERP